VERDLNFSLTLRLSLSTLAEFQVFSVSPGVEEIHLAGTINNVETSYFTQLKMLPNDNVSMSRLDCLQLDGARDLEIACSHVWLSW